MESASIETEIVECENYTLMNVRFAAAMAAYAVLALLGWVTLTGKIRLALWIFLAGLAVKTVIAVASQKDGN